MKRNYSQPRHLCTIASARITGYSVQTRLHKYGAAVSSYSSEAMKTHSYEPVDLMYFGISFLAYLARSLRCAKNFILGTTQGVVPVVKFTLRLDLERKSY